MEWSLAMGVEHYKLRRPAAAQTRLGAAA